MASHRKPWSFHLLAVLFSMLGWSLHQVRKRYVCPVKSWCSDNICIVECIFEYTWPLTIHIVIIHDQIWLLLLIIIAIICSYHQKKSHWYHCDHLYIWFIIVLIIINVFTVVIVHVVILIHVIHIINNYHSSYFNYNNNDRYYEWQSHLSDYDSTMIQMVIMIVLW